MINSKAVYCISFLNKGKEDEFMQLITDIEKKTDNEKLLKAYADRIKQPAEKDKKESKED